MKKIENSKSRQITYSKRREALLKKAGELSDLCDTDVAVLMFSPRGRLTTYAHRKRIEDVFLRYIELPNSIRGSIEDEEYLHWNLKSMKQEAEISEKLEKIEALKGKLSQLNQQNDDLQKKMSCYNPVVGNIMSIDEAHLHEQFLSNALQSIEKLKKDKLLENQISLARPGNAEASGFLMERNLAMGKSLNWERSQLRDSQEAGPSTGTHRSMLHVPPQNIGQLEL